MALTEEGFYQILQDTSVSTLGLQVERFTLREPVDDSPLTVDAKISGAWYGQVCLQCTVPLGRLVAAAIFQIDGGKAGGEEILNALCDPIHIIGGNLKSLLPQPVTLSLPFVLIPQLRSKLRQQSEWFAGLPFKATAIPSA